MSSLYRAREAAHATSMRMFGLTRLRDCLQTQRKKMMAFGRKGSINVLLKTWGDAFKKRNVNPEEITWLKGGIKNTQQNTASNTVYEKLAMYL